ncbi:MAG TPA: hypothetical protein VK961_26965 [Chthoniobacter sp.]|nr:hypothetical protein [Chthoniobacter sp.]
MAVPLSPRRGFWHGILLATCFFAAAAVTASLIDGNLPFPSVPEISPRFRYFAQHKNEFDTIFIGSSRIRHQVIPEQFDREVGEKGRHVRSFNLGYSGMWPPESYYYLRQVLALRPKKLRWVILELMDYRFGQVEGQVTTMRSVYWHDAKHTAMAFRLVVELPLPAMEKLKLVAGHAQLFLQRMANLGRGAEWLQARYFSNKKKTDMSWVKRSGFDPEPLGEWSESAKTEFKRQILAFEQAPPVERLRPGLAIALREIDWQVRQAGAELILVVPPTVRPEERLAPVPPNAFGFFAFDNPTEYPRLYLPELHYDPGHLNEAGAREFTSLVAQRFVTLLQTW